jgi:hypothetical protein
LRLAIGATAQPRGVLRFLAKGALRLLTKSDIEDVKAARTQHDGVGKGTKPTAQKNHLLHHFHGDLQQVREEPPSQPAKY